jgi:hypothetical protein
MISTFGVPDDLSAHRNLLAAQAEWHALAGRSVIPIRLGSKEPAVPRWKPFQRRPATPEQVREWFASPEVGGYAIILGPVSRYLGNRDFDDAGAYERWRAAHPGLANQLPTFRTARGYGVMFTGPEGFAKGEDGEYRASSGCYQVLPASIHPSGVLYQWLRPLSAEKPPDIPNPLAVGLLPPGTTLSSYPPVEETPKPPIRKMSKIATRSISNFGGAIRRTLPTGPGQRNKRLFDLARTLKNQPGAADLPADTWYSVAQAWWNAALPFIRTKDWATTWKGFLRAYGNARPCGAEILGAAKAYAEQMEPGLYGDVEEMRHSRLIYACEHLQIRQPGAPFYLSVRQAGEILGVGKSTAAVLLQGLVRAGLLELIPERKGSQETGLASYYWYRGPSFHEALLYRIA